MKSQLILSALAMSLSLNVFAADVKTLQVKEQVEINAPAAQVWAKVRDFGDLGAWHPAVTKTEIISGKDNQKGAVRELTLQDGGKIHEKLRAHHDQQMSYEYEILDGVLPVSHYVSTISVKSQGANKSLVTWQGHFKRKDTSASPAAGADDETATKTITSVYRGGLDNLKKISE